ncbi:hypothetical protein BKP37_10630 [Anaerobacillus alkalilacustris]|uniref:DUF3918 domain-containing protein n=1 Tax=Anaerobacillus alkalilacustris TaxID=393763 RepID=A0A1S2LMJ0_9BACI|nr:hypothetical protein [Anaerobacillus alkalilacustris]OIJ13420.1 hypothetical protein BKP37_10630 [Anaerobacillus alkalilacustris]
MNWLFSSFRTGRGMQRMLEMMGMRRRQNNRGLMLSIVGLGLGAAAARMMRGRNMNDVMVPIKDKVQQIDIRNPIS